MVFFSSVRQSMKTTCQKLMNVFSFGYLGFKNFQFILVEIAQIKFKNFNENKNYQGYTL